MRAHLTLKGRLLQWLLERRNSTVLRMMGPAARADLRGVAEVATRATPLLQDAAMLTIMACVRDARRRGGAMAEAGVFAGATARLICAEKGDAPLHLFDVFESLQGATAGADADAEAVRAHFRGTHATRAGVEALLADQRAVHFHVGVFPGTTAGLESERFSFVHLDLDLPGATRAGLEFFHPRLLSGGILIGDDYHDPSVREVFDTYFAGRADNVIGLPWGQGLVIAR